MSRDSHLTTTEEAPLPNTYQKQDDVRPNSRRGEIEDLRREHASVYAYLMSVVREDDKRRLIAALVNHGGMTYDALDQCTAVSRRRMRDRVYELDEKGVVDITDSKTAFVHFASKDIRLLAEDALSYFFTD